jgi:hypothetical protein
MREIIVAGVITGLLGMLTGCQDKVDYEDTRALENPPPKPPNCPELPELKDITLKDGTIADVRIFKFMDRMFYIPTDSFGGKFVDDDRSLNGGFIRKQNLGVWIPDEHALECPGVVHVAVSVKAIGYNLRIGFRDDWNRNAFPNSKVDQVRFFPNIYKAKTQVRNGPKLDTNSADVEIYPRVFATYDWPKDRTINDPEWAWYRDSARELFDWLTTPPRLRDNNRKFAIGVKPQ